MSDKIYGIDLGTTNSCLSVLEDGRPRVVLVDGNGIVPSVVSVDGGKTLVGREALNRSVAFPESSCRSVKRLMGSDAKISLGRKKYRPEEISAMILGHLVKEADRLEGKEVKRAVITVPAYFTDAQRRATREAGEMAGLEVERLINEPTAAALYYDLLDVGKNEGGSARGWRHALVYDLGGGTFDVSILRMGEIIEVVSTTGDTKLGGDDFDALIAQFLAAKAKKEIGLDPSLYPPGMARLLRAAEKAKMTLSDRGAAAIEEAAIPVGKSGKTCGLVAELKRDEFEQMARPLIDKTITLVREALQESRLNAAEIDRVVLVGGMTRMPAISEALGKIFGKAQLPAVDPHLAVAHGAAVQGSIISGENVNQILVDVTAHTLSMQSLEALNLALRCVPIIPRNTPVPAKRSRIFYTISNNQEMVLLKIFQGESSNPDENKPIGAKFLRLAPAPAGSQVEVEFSYDLNGIIHVIGEHRGYGRKIELDIDRRSSKAVDEERLFSSALDSDDGEDEDEDGLQDEAPVRRGTNLVIRRAESIINGLPPDSPGREEIGSALKLYREALEESLDEDSVDNLEDALLGFMESWS